MESKIKSFEDACAALNISTDVPVVATLPLKHQKALVAHYKLITIAEALNEGWEPNWNDSDERKYFPWLEVEASEEQPAGVGFSHAYYDYGHSTSLVGSRLCFKSSELAMYAGEQFADLYAEYFLITKQQ